jgi:hypothetical protein
MKQPIPRCHLLSRGPHPPSTPAYLSLGSRNAWLGFNDALSCVGYPLAVQFPPPEELLRGEDSRKDSSRRKVGERGEGGRGLQIELGVGPAQHQLIVQQLKIKARGRNAEEYLMVTLSVPVPRATPMANIAVLSAAIISGVVAVAGTVVAACPEWMPALE